MKNNYEKEIMDSMSSFLSKVNPNTKVASSGMTFHKFAEAMQLIADKLDEAGAPQLAEKADVILSSVVNDMGK